MKTRAFTLIELLAVIAIIAVLAGLMIPLVAGAGDKAKRAATRATIGDIEASILQFKMMNNGLYPLDTDGRGIMNDGTEYHPEFKDALATVNSDSFGPQGVKVKNGEIVDAWDRRIHYRPFIAYPDPNEALYNVNPESYQLWSRGSDGVDNTSDGDLDTGDDITNWSR
jgi:general secretion pathway protein G